MGGHGEVPAASGSPSGSASASERSLGVLSHAHHEAETAASPASDAPPPPLHRDQPHGDHPCDCLSHCCASAVAAPGAFSATLVVGFQEPERATPGGPHPFAPHWVDFVLPFATAPPSMVTG